MAIKIPSDYYKPSAKSALMGLISLTAFSGGVYRGVCAINGTPVEPTLENILMWAPSIIAVPLVYKQIKEMVSDERIKSQIKEQTPSQMPELAEGCTTGYTTIVVPLISAGLVRLIHGAGYLVGNLIGRHS